MTKLTAETNKALAEARLANAEADFKELEVSRLRATSAEHNVFTFYADVDDTSVYNSLNSLSTWSRRHPGEDLHIVLNSPGGSVIAGLALYDFLQDMKQSHFITVTTIGMAASMGGILLQAGHHRVASKNAFILIHEVSASSYGKITEMEDETTFLVRLQEKLMAILAERSSMTPRQIKARMKRKDWWMDAEQALELGFIDAIR